MGEAKDDIIAKVARRPGDVSGGEGSLTVLASVLREVSRH
jgi:hypothetical protein